MDNLVLFSFFRKIIAVLHWLFYGFGMVIVILHAEIWFYGVKINGYPAILIYFTIGIVGILLGFLILRQKKIAYFGAIALFVLVLLDIIINRLTV